MPYEGNIVEIPIAQGGYDASENEAGVLYTRYIKANNISYYDNILQKEGGTSKKNSSAIDSGAAIIGGTDYWVTSSLQRIVVATSTGKLIKDDCSWAFATTLKTGLGTDKKTVFCEGGKETAGAAKHLFAFNGYDPVQVLDDDGVATGDLATPPADWSGNNQPIKGAIHRNRLYAIYSHFLYGSTLSDHEDFTSAGNIFLPVYMGEGTQCTNIVSAMGRLFIFKKNGLYYLDDSNTDSQYWSIKKVNTRVGCIGVDALDNGKNEVVFISSDGGVHYLSGVQEFGDVKDSDITEILNLKNYLKNTIKRSRLDRCVVRYNEDRKVVYIAYTSSAASRNDRILKLDIKDLSNIKPSITDKDNCESMWSIADATTKVDKVQLGTSDGYVCDTELSTLYATYAGSPFVGEVQTPFIDFSHLDRVFANKNKIFDWIELHLLSLGAYDVSVDEYIDSNKIATITFNQGQAGFILGTSTLGSPLGGATTILKRKKPLYGSGRTLSLKFHNSGLNQTFKIVKCFIGFRIAGEDLRT